MTALRVAPIVIRNGTLIDGTGTPGRRADVAVANGKVVAPGFIDIKTHSDWTLPLMPRAESKIRQGVTTEVIGHCGYSCAPALPGKVEALAEYLR